MPYTTWGRVRGDCGHAHRTLASAQACLARDQRGCARQGGYSDREIRFIRDRYDVVDYDVRVGPGRPLSEAVPWESTVYTDHGQSYEAVFLRWDAVQSLLGHAHRGEPTDDATLIALLTASGAPFWVTAAEGWTDSEGWGLIGPAITKADAGA